MITWFSGTLFLRIIITFDLDTRFSIFTLTPFSTFLSIFVFGWWSPTCFTSTKNKHQQHVKKLSFGHSKSKTYIDATTPLFEINLYCLPDPSTNRPGQVGTYMYVLTFYSRDHTKISPSTQHADIKLQWHTRYRFQVRANKHNSQYTLLI